MRAAVFGFFVFHALYLAASPTPILVDSFSVDNFTGSSSASGTSIVITNSSTVNFQDQSTAGNASISIDGTSLLNFAQNAASTYSGMLSGTGSVTKTGTGNLTISGNNSAFTGPLSVQNGTLFLVGAYGGSVSSSGTGNIVYEGAITGNLTVNGGSITTNGVQALQVQGNYIQSNGAVYIANVNSSGQSSEIVIQGTAAITGGFVQPNISNGFLINHLYTILHANGGVSGVYGLINPYPALKVLVSYDPDNVYLSFSTNFLGVAVTSNQQNVATQLDGIQYPTPDENEVIVAVAQLDAEGVQNALDLLSGEQYSNFILTSLYGDSRFSKRIYNAYRDLIDPCVKHCSGINNWISVGGGQASQKGNVQGRGFDLSNFDVSTGMHACIAEPWLLGGALGFESDFVHSKLGSRATLLTAEAAIYTALQSKYVYLLSDVMGAYTWSEYDRHIDFSSLNRTAKSSPRITHGRMDVEIGLNLGGCAYQLQPYVAASGEVYHQNRIHEKNAGSINLLIDPITKWLASTLLGFHFNIHSNVSIYFDLAWEHDYGNLRVSESAQFEGFGTPFLIKGPERGHDGLTSALLLSVPVNARWNFYVEASGEIWRNWSAYEGNAGVNYRW